MKAKKIALTAGILGLLLIWNIFTPSGLLGKSDAVGYAVCHRLTDHSYFLGERPLSLCARCTGEFLAVLVGAVVQAAAGGRRQGFPRRGLLAVLGFLVLFFVIDGLNSVLSQYLNQGTGFLYQPANILRLASGAGMGLAISGVIYPLANQMIWLDQKSGAVLSNIWHELAFLASGGLMIVMIESRNPLLLYPLTIFSTVGIIFLLSVAYSLMLIILRERENTFVSGKELIWWGVGGFGITLLQIAVINWLRYSLTGTWSGF